MKKTIKTFSLAACSILMATSASAHEDEFLSHAVHELYHVAMLALAVAVVYKGGQWLKTKYQQKRKSRANKA
ncbi:hypothetical protein C2869_20785 [Saccharobesus litoralis]|uniref:Uncharacterized protein n=1 Tax=Saccharobesus litoralis TaxID=2172099 RepID=A0A2S0VWT8_9ALTE|nr:hypothetical protein [Saccharobesus litoralis]AWB68681.1 hypothetical protein C2869_20785 [Saccharobesus litoralis]